MRRNVLIYSILGMIHTKNGFIGEDDCSNDPCMIVRVSFFSSLILPFLHPIYIGLATRPYSYIVCKRILRVLVVAVIELSKFEDCSKFRQSTGTRYHIGP